MPQKKAKENLLTVFFPRSVAAYDWYYVAGSKSSCVSQEYMLILVEVEYGVGRTPSFFYQVIRECFEVGQPRTVESTCVDLTPRHPLSLEITRTNQSSSSNLLHQS